VARIAIEYRFQPSGGGWARFRLACRAASAPEAQYDLKKWPLGATERGGRPMRWHGPPPNAHCSIMGVGGQLT